MSLVASSVETIAEPFFIGSLKVDPPILQAPMAGFTNYAFRQIVREFGGAGLLATEMVNARGFVWLDAHVEYGDGRNYRFHNDGNSKDCSLRPELAGFDR